MFYTEYMLPNGLLKENVYDSSDIVEDYTSEKEDIVAPQAFIDYSKASPEIIPFPEAELDPPTSYIAIENKNSVEELHSALFGDDVQGLLRGAKFITTLAEAESGRGRYQSNPKSSAAGFFHFLVQNGGGYTKDGVKSPLGQYTKKGDRAVSSFQFAKDSLAKIAKKVPQALNNQDLATDLSIIASASTPRLLTAKQQSLLAYAYMYNRAPKDFTSYIKGKKAGVDLYAKEWVTLSGSHTYSDISRNWNRALIKTTDHAGNLNFIGITMPVMGKLTPMLDSKKAAVTRPALTKQQQEAKKALLNKKLNLL